MQQNYRDKITIITGPTATGKTKLALELAHKYNGDLINCDSRQIYKHLDIVTGKDLTDHKFHLVNKLNNFDIGFYSANYSLLTTNYSLIWLYDITDPKQYFSSFDYTKCALYAIKKILKKDKIPIIVGGTYFYLYHLLYEVETEKIPPDWELRKELEQKTINELQIILKKVKPQLVRQLNHSDLNNPQRLIRKIEIATKCRDALQCVSTLKFEFKSFFKKFDIEFIALRFQNKEKMYTAIKNRVEERLKKGAIEEVGTLLKMGYTAKDPGLQTIGCKQILKYLKGEITKEEAINEWITKELQYSKRQFTFMKRDPHLLWKES